MRISARYLMMLGLVVVTAASSVVAMQWQRRGNWRGDMDERRGVPVWDVQESFPKDVFTFARVQYSDGYGRYGYGGGGYGGSRSSRGWGKWATDLPDSDLNFSLRLHQLTSIAVNPNPEIVTLDSEEVFDYPFLYLIEPGLLEFRPEEIEGLRKYCLNGGFLMVDDFWGNDEWDNFYFQIKRVFPDREPEEVPLEHDIFQCVYPLKEKPQIPSVGAAWRYGITWESRGRHSEEEVRTPHYRAIYDDAQRIMVFICHNTDLGDGWEEEGVDPDYFQEFSVKKSYPLGINIVTYAMTH
ncbi:MAG: DUF4159 domain-containing protein [Planctomycetales bacterium]|nr:DUF4159 domain-containing protein [Planctomycetales bacterium]